MRKMKDSGIEWIGDIPIDWDIIRFRFLCKVNTGNQDTQDAEIDGQYPFYVRSPIVRTSNRTTFNCESILMAGDGAGAGRIFHHAKGEYAVHQRVYCFNNFTSECIRYVYYYISTLFEVEMDKGSSQTTVPSVRLPMIQNFNVCKPKFDEQKKIADFLDEKCSEIDCLIADIKSQIEVLEQYKKSIIYDKVCKGIYQNVSLKKTDDCVWEEIPENWHLKDIKYLFEIVKRIAGAEGYDILSVTQKGLKIKDINNNGGQLASDYSNYQFVYEGDFVMNHMDLLTGWVDISSFFGVTSPDYRVFRLLNNNSNSQKYFLYLLQCCYLNRIFYSLGQGVSNLGRWRLQTSTFMNFKFPVPPLSEQYEIAEYLDKKCSDIEETINEKQSQILTLEEYKKSMIFEYVTGKKQV